MEPPIAVHVLECAFVHHGVCYSKNCPSEHLDVTFFMRKRSRFGHARACAFALHKQMYMYIYFFHFFPQLIVSLQIQNVGIIVGVKKVTASKFYFKGDIIA